MGEKDERILSAAVMRLEGEKVRAEMTCNVAEIEVIHVPVNLAYIYL